MRQEGNFRLSASPVSGRVIRAMALMAILVGAVLILLAPAPDSGPVDPLHSVAASGLLGGRSIVRSTW